MFTKFSSLWMVAPLLFAASAQAAEPTYFCNLVEGAPHATSLLGDIPMTEVPILGEDSGWTLSVSVGQMFASPLDVQAEIRLPTHRYSPYGQTGASEMGASVGLEGKIAFHGFALSLGASAQYRPSADGDIVALDWAPEGNAALSYTVDDRTILVLQYHYSENDWSPLEAVDNPKHAVTIGLHYDLGGPE